MQVAFNPTIVYLIRSWYLQELFYQKNIHVTKINVQCSTRDFHSRLIVARPMFDNNLVQLTCRVRGTFLTINIPNLERTITAIKSFDRNFVKFIRNKSNKFMRLVSRNR